jgi:acetyl esterase/lipase
MATMIGTTRSLGNLPVFRAFGRIAVAAAVLALGGCADVFFAGAARLAPAPGVEQRAGIEFDPEHHLSLDAYRPTAATAAPVVVFFYGGSWESGKRRWYRYVGEQLASHGVVTVIPDYRKFPAVRFPAFMHDAARAVAWVHAHATELGGDARRLFVMGHSAGGQIAALLADDPRYLAAVGLRRSDLAGMIGVAGAYAFLPFEDDEAQIFGDDVRGRHDSQPVNFVDGGEPPMLLLQGASDDEVPPRNARLMAERVEAAGGSARLRLYPGVGHNAILLALARGRQSRVPTLADTLAFVADPSGDPGF